MGQHFGGIPLVVRALALVAIAGGAGASAEKATPRPRYATCALFTESYVDTYSQREPGGMVPREALGSGDWVVAESYGVLQVDSYDAATGRLRARLPGRRLDTVSILDVDPDARFARLGSYDARELVRARTERAFPRKENFDTFFATRGLLAQLRAAPTVDAPMRETARQVWTTVSAADPAWRGRDLDTFMLSMRYLYELGGIQTFVTTPAAAREANTLMRTFADEFYRRTGHNLVQGGILESNLHYWNYDGTKGFLAERLGKASDNMLRAPNGQVGGPMDRVPLDVFHEIIVQQWRESEAHFGGLGRSTVSLVSFDSHATDGHAGERAGALRAFKESGDLAGIRELLDGAAADPGFAAWKSTVAAGGADVRFVPMPGSEGPSRATAALAGWALGALGVGAVADGAVRLAGPATPQKFQSTLWHRITNMQSRDYEVSGEVRGKVVVLVDDVITTGVTLEAMKQRLLEKGARAVYVFSLARTGTEPVTPAPETILDLAHTTPPPAAPSDEPMPGEAAQFGPWLDRFLGQTEKPAWERSGKPSPEAVAERADFERLLVAEVGARLAAGGRLPWDGKIVRDLTAPAQTTKKVFEAIFKRRDLALLSRLPAGALETIGAAGRTATKKTSLRGEIADNDVELTSWLRSLHAARDREEFGLIRDSALAKLVFEEAKARRGKPGPFRNQLDAASGLETWLDAQ